MCRDGASPRLSALPLTRGSALAGICRSDFRRVADSLRDGEAVVTRAASIPKRRLLYAAAIALIAALIVVSGLRDRARPPSPAELPPAPARHVNPSLPAAPRGEMASHVLRGDTGKSRNRCLSPRGVFKLRQLDG
jgi:hypothetical protein